MYQKTHLTCGIKRCVLFLFLTAFIFGSSVAQNLVYTENLQPGVPSATWDIPNNGNGTHGDLSIQGFATDISVNKGGTINFKITVTTGVDKTFGIQIYRLGYYQGNGARLIADLGTAFTGIAQNACDFESATGLTDCGNWTTTTRWTVPSTAVSGYYIAKLTRSAAGGGGSSHIAFIVRDDASTSKLFFKASDATWQAYNGYGGYSLYLGPGMPTNHANKVSYNRPFLTRNVGGGGGAEQDWLFNSEYPMIRFLEGNGYDISYTTDLDITRNNANNINQILAHKVFLSVGHDEYWSKEERNSVEAAKAAGVHMAFFSGNEIYWKTRWENSIDGNDVAFRTLVCYKEGTLATPAENPCGGKCDPSPEWTGLWRDGCSYPSGNACKPENALSGQISWDGNSTTMLIPAAYKNLRFWRNTPVAALPVGGTAAMTPRTLGYEWDWEQYQNNYPPGRVTMSSTDFDGHTHKLSLYKAPSGAIIFGAGTVQWAWGLDAVHDAGNDPANISMQQATINLLADMGAQPDPSATLITGLTRAVGTTDVSPPVTVITTPANGANLNQGAPITITGTAVDNGGGLVAGVDISVDGGLTWQPATGTTNWTFAWTPANTGSVTIKSRAYDDIGNLESPGGSEGSSNTVDVNVVVGPPNCPCSVFTPPQQSPPASDEIPPATPDLQVTLGMKFRSSLDGIITKIRFYKAPDDNATDHTVQLWAIDGSPLADVPVSGTLPAGWNEVTLPSPVGITANTLYVVSYFCSSGIYMNTNSGLLNAVVNGPLTAIANDDPPTGNDAGNGVYQYNNGSAVFPNQTYQATNYWVDVVFYNGPDNISPTVISTSPVSNASNINVNTFVSATFSEAIDQTTISGATVLLKDATNTTVPATLNYAAGSNSVTIVPLSPLDYTSVYTATILGGTSGIKDLAGNALVGNYTWTFTTSNPPPIPPDDGSGGPVLVISNSTDPFSRYMVEILRAQGYTAFKAIDISEARADWSVMDNYDVVLFGRVTVTAADVTALSNWITAGGTLIAQRPSSLLLPLMGVTQSVGVSSDQYIKINTAAGLPGVGIYNQTMQFHGPSDRYNLIPGTASLATLYQDAFTNTIYESITSRIVGLGRAVAFAFDLGKSVVLTRQGNPLWVGQKRDGQSGPVRSDDMFFPNYVDFNKIQVPQADEQQHLLTNIILLNNLHKKPLPHLWILPRGLKAAVVMTGDDHNVTPGSTIGRFNEYMTLGPNTPQDVLDWNAIRGTSYIYNNTAISPADVSTYQNLGFEIALHPTTNCVNYTPSSLSSNMSTQLADLAAQLPTLIPPVTNRTHCLPWSDWASQAKVENSLGIRFDVNYYYWPASWVNNRPGLFTGSGMPMRFADDDGSLIDCYQAPTQMPDESGLDITNSINTLLDNAINKGYYGAFVMNMHTDTAIHIGSNEIIASAQARNIPVITSKQMLDWLDTRNNTAFSNMTWLNSKLSFHISTSAHNLQAMVPFNSADGTLIQVTENGSDHPYSLQTIKGISYGVFSASTNDYVAIYTSVPLPVTFTRFTVAKQQDDALLNWTTSMEQNNKGFEIQRSTDQSSWTAIGFVAGSGNSQTSKDYQYLDKNLLAGTYYYRLRQVDYDGHSQFSRILSVTFDGETSLALLQNRPNPFNTSTTIMVTIPRAGRVLLSLYDQMGRPLQVLMDEYKSPGTYNIQVNRNGLSSGNYYYKMEALGQSIVRKMTIL